MNASSRWRASGQVATTAFQAFFWSGYRLEERNWHLYWIPAYTSRGVVGL